MVNNRIVLIKKNQFLQNLVKIIQQLTGKKQGKKKKEKEDH